jgi:aspartate dehydrogenase
MNNNDPLRVAVAGLGAIGLEVARRIDAGDLPGIALVAVSARDRTRAERRLSGFCAPPQVLPLDGLAAVADIVVECAPAAVFLEIAESVIAQGRTLVPLSVGVLLNHPELIGRLEETGARIMVPTGALLGLDAVRAVAEGKVDSIRLTTRKPPAGLKGAPWLALNGIDIDAITEPTRIFSGNAREAARGFPANVNVAAALALAGIGPERTEVEIWADPTVTRNTHRVTVEADAARLTMTIEGIPSPDNPATGRITALSVIATLRRLTAPMVVGT